MELYSLSINPVIWILSFSLVDSKLIGNCVVKLPELYPSLINGEFEETLTK